MILADAYNKPSVWLKKWATDISKSAEDDDFHFHDYFESQGREFKYITELKQLSEDAFYTGGNKIDLDEMMKAYPFRKTE